MFIKKQSKSNSNSSNKFWGFFFFLNNISEEGKASRTSPVELVIALL
jgi:hypothetical protein